MTNQEKIPHRATITNLFTMETVEFSRLLVQYLIENKIPHLFKIEFIEDGQVDIISFGFNEKTQGWVIVRIYANGDDSISLAFIEMFEELANGR